MNEYHKIQTVFLRDPETKYKTLLEKKWAKPEFEYLKDNPWVFTEKVDGTNIRVQWDGQEMITFAGKTDNADMPKFLVSQLERMFTAYTFDHLAYPAMCLYGEGYGAKIQKGGDSYIHDGVSFILFDVQINGIWLERHNIEDIADKLGIPIVPIVGTGTLLEGVEMVRNGYQSKLRALPPEGLVMRPAVEMLDRLGNRVITKIKMKDFKRS